MEQPKMLPYPPMAPSGCYVGCIDSRKVRAVYAKALHECGLSRAELDALLTRELRVHCAEHIRTYQFQNLMNVILPRHRKPGHVNKKPASSVPPLVRAMKQWDQVKTNIDHKEKR